MGKSSIEHRLLHDHDLHLLVEHTEGEQHFKITLHRDKDQKMNDPAARHVLSIHVPPPPPAALSPPRHRTPAPPEN